MLNGQYGILVVACTLGVWWLIRRRHDAWAGALLTLATIKPSISLLAPLVILLWALRWRRWHIPLGFLITLSMLMGVTVWRIGWWLPDFWRATQSFAAKPGSWMTRDIFTLPGWVWMIGAVGVCFVGLGRLWRERDFPWLAIIGAQSLNLLSLPHLLEYDLSVLLLVWFWFGTRWRRARWGWALWLGLIWTPWLSWVISLMFGVTIDDWWKWIWQFYPSLVIYTIGVWLWYASRTNSITRALSP